MKVIAEASDGASAIQRALELKPDVVVMDISMPGMNGLVATRTLKQARPNMAIITLTGTATMPTCRSCYGRECPDTS